MRDAYEGLQIFGATGAGKSTSSGKAALHAFLKMGIGGLILTTKTDDASVYLKACLDAGRLGDVRVITTGERDYVFYRSKVERFNFLNRELTRAGPGGGLTHNLVYMLGTVAEVGSGRSSRGKADPFWDFARDEMLVQAIEILTFARGRLTLPELYEFVSTAPSTPAMLEAEVRRAESKQPGKLSFAYECLRDAQTKLMQRQVPDAKYRDLLQAAIYWQRRFPTMGARTQSSIIAHFTGIAMALLSSPIREIFCSDQPDTIQPSDTFTDDTIIIIDLPVKEFHHVGRYTQAVFKYAWQMDLERRDISVHPKPTFLFADESQNFVTSFDAQFQSTARSKRACTVYLTQNLCSYIDEMGGPSAEPAVMSLLGNLNTRVFHSQGDSQTNDYASRLAGRAWRIRRNRSYTQGSDGIAKSIFQPSSPSHTRGMNEEVIDKVLSETFTRFRTGGRANDFKVDAMIFQSGRTWNGPLAENYLMHTFEQML
ncbi:MAG: TraM recognition domain-containing protein [Phycisphaerae bacterium]|nr:TraM recognition domain-containing protein [Phycisphaerae bacterium]